MSDLIPAFGYLRTSSATNVGDDKDSDTRQMIAIEAIAARKGYIIKAWFYDADVRGDVQVSARPAFVAMIEALASNGVRTVFVEEIGRFSRETTVGLVGVATLKKLDVTLFDRIGMDITNPKDPMEKAMLQMMFVFAELDKNMTVAKLKGARDRKSAEIGRRVEGPKPAPEAHRTLANVLRAEGLSLRAIADRLAAEGYLTVGSGKVYGAESIKRMLEG